MLRRSLTLLTVALIGSTISVAPAAENGDILRLPHLVADRTAKRIEIDARTTDVKESDILEFLLIAEPSGHTYESLAVSAVKPSDVQKALKFIGMEPGHGIDPAKLRFWPKGERVIVSVLLKNAPAGTKPVRAEHLVLNERTKEPIPEAGFVYIGSQMIDEQEFDDKAQETKKTGRKVLAADVREPNSIIANYNESDSVFDVPRQAPQNDVYRSQVANPKMMLPTNAPVTFIIEPEYKDGKKRVKNLALTASPAEGGGSGLEGTVFDLVDTDSGKALLDKSALNPVLKTFTALVEQGHDPFVTLHLADELTVGTVHQVCRLLGSVDVDTGIRMEPPPEGQLYYRAFTPNEKLRKREDRIVQPWELHLSLADGKLSGRLVALNETWHEDRLKPDLEASETAVADAAALTAQLARDAAERKKAKESPRLAIILVFAPPAVTHSRLMAFIGPALETHPIIHIYLATEE